MHEGTDISFRSSLPYKEGRTRGENNMSVENNEPIKKPVKALPADDNEGVVFYDNPKDISSKTPLPQKAPDAAKKAAPTPVKSPVKTASKKNVREISSDKNKNAKKDTNNKSKKDKSSKLPRYRLVINIIASVLSVLFVVAGVGLIVAYTYFHRINYQDIPKESSEQASKTSYINSEAAESNPTGEVNTYDGELLNDPMVLNIMLFGEDTRKGSTTGNSDTMMIFSIDTRHKKLKLLSLMRDTYVDIPGYGENRLNSAYAYGGAALTVSTVQKNYGIKIDRYAVVDFNSFKKIIDTLGGIDVELTSEEIDYINWQSWTNHQVDTRDELDVNSYYFYENDEGNSVAMVHLNGRQALWHARNRGQDGICSGDDYVRTQRQRQVINVIIDDLKKADIATVMSIIYEIGPMITTNVKTSEITSLASNITTYLQYDLESRSAPMRDEFGTVYYFSDDNHPVYINGAMASVILIYDWDAFRQEIAEFIYEEQVAKPEEEETADAA